ncbi:MAG: hypothetical protein KJZ84_02065 [Bryobacteraceae bacterium]|nr:hypothetical protein [Bryobacteraceae bacterium]
MTSAFLSTLDSLKAQAIYREIVGQWERSNLRQSAHLTADHPMRNMILLTKVKVLRAQSLSAEAKRAEKQFRSSANSAQLKRQSISWGELSRMPK